MKAESTDAGRATEQHQRARSLTYVTAATITAVSNPVVVWLVLVVRVPAEPSRHRVAVWRELRKSGAVSLAQGAWAVPDVPGFAAMVPVRRRGGIQLVEAAGGHVGQASTAVTQTWSPMGIDDSSSGEVSP